MMVIDFLSYKQEAKNRFVTYLGFTKLIINEQDPALRTCKNVEYTCRNCMKTKEELAEAIKGIITK